MKRQLSATQDPQLDELIGPLYIGTIRIDEIFERKTRASAIFRLQLDLKRIFDIVASALLILIVSPIMLASMLAVRLSSSGPILFSQLRWGLGQRHFRCFKIRSMYVERSENPRNSQFSPADSPGVLQKMKNDPRVTPVGNILRKTSIDELPQLINVFLGDMSIVGPRPLVLHMLDPFPQIREARCIIRPGITGLWQLRNRANNTSVMYMLADDCEYIARFNLLLDFKILLATPLAVIRGSGAH
jgi:lipopolysaccharide/colanic/teichoic acid biosynthesis glycosyltransferase